MSLAPLPNPMRFMGLKKVEYGSKERGTGTVSPSHWGHGGDLSGVGKSSCARIRDAFLGLHWYCWVWWWTPECGSWPVWCQESGLGGRSVVLRVSWGPCFGCHRNVPRAFHGRYVWFDLHIVGHRLCKWGSTLGCGFCSRPGIWRGSSASIFSILSVFWLFNIGSNCLLTEI